MAVAELEAGTELGPDHSGAYRYEIDRLLGSGGFGITYRARDRRLEGWVVIKELAFEGSMYRNTTNGELMVLRGQEELRAKLIRHFLKEARLLNRLRDPHIVRVVDVWEERGTAYYAMDEIDAAGHLAAYPVRDANGALPISGIKTQLLQVLHALEVVHDAGLIHGDIKPENILVNQQGEIILIDFGTARSGEDIRKTATSMAYTQGYAPPELMHPSRIKEAGPHSDLYSWAMLAVGLFVGHPTENHHPLDAYARIMGDTSYDGVSSVLVSSGLEAGWASAIARCLILEPGARPQSVTELRQSLAGTLAMPQAPGPVGTHGGSQTHPHRPNGPTASPMPPVADPPTHAGAPMPPSGMHHGYAGGHAPTPQGPQTAPPSMMAPGTGYGQAPTGYGQGPTGYGQGPTGYGQPPSQMAPQSLMGAAPPPAKKSRKGMIAVIVALIVAIAAVLGLLISAMGDGGEGATEGRGGDTAETEAADNALREWATGNWTYDLATSSMQGGELQPDSVVRMFTGGIQQLILTPDGTATQSSTSPMTGYTTNVGTWSVTAGEPHGTLTLTLNGMPLDYVLEQVGPNTMAITLIGQAERQIYQRSPL